jgi:DNA-binding protein HU-beta
MMNKTEFIRALAEKNDISIKEAGTFFEGLVGVVSDALKAGEKVNITGFGAFELKSKPEREGINPLTGAKVKIAACKAPSLKFSKTYKEGFNK